MPPGAEPHKPMLPIRVLDQFGAVWLHTFWMIGGVFYLILDVSVWVIRALFQRRVRFGRCRSGPCP